MLAGHKPTCGLAGKWSDRFACDDARSCGPCLFTSADDGRQDTTLTCLYPNDWGPFAQVIDAADPWCGLTCAWGFFTGTLVVFVTLLIGQKLRRAPRQHKGNDGDHGIGSRQTPTDSQVGPQRQLPISPQRPAQRDIPRFHVDRPTFAQQNVATVHREWHFLLLGPELSKELVALNLPVPCDVPAATRAINAVRDEARRALYDNLVPVTPQPSDEFGTVLSIPSSISQHCVVCLDSRECDDRLFCRCLPQRMNRESLLIAAGSLQTVTMACTSAPRGLRSDPHSSSL